VLLLFFTLFVNKSFPNEENDNNDRIQFIKTLKVPEGVLFSVEGDTLMNSCNWDQFFFPEKLSFWKLRRSKIERYSLSSNSYNSFPLNFDFWEKESRILKTQKIPLSRNLAKFDTMILVSPNEEYILFRFGAITSELFEIKTGKWFSSGIDNEMIIGFNHDSNIFCQKQNFDNTFILRDIKTMKVMKMYIDIKKSKNHSFVSNSSEYFHSYMTPIESFDNKYTLFILASNQSDENGIVCIIDNENESIIEKTPIKFQIPFTLKPLFRRDNKVVGIPNGIKSIWLYDFEKNKFQNIIFPFDGIIQGFEFYSNNSIVVWTKHPFDVRFGSAQQPTAYQFNLDTEKCVPFADYQHPEYYTRFYNFDADKNIVITYETIPGQNPREFVGKYVFWNMKTKKSFFETQDDYFPNIIISPDKKYVYLTTQKIISERQEQYYFIVDVYEIK
jgi:hypothetical protein